MANRFAGLFYPLKSGEQKQEVETKPKSKPKPKDELPRTMTGVHKATFFHHHLEKDANGFFYHLKSLKDPLTTPAEAEHDEKETLAKLAALDDGTGPKISTGQSHSSLSNLQVNVRLVFWECKMKRLCEINTTHETFRCRLHYYLTWLATKDELKDYENFHRKYKNTAKANLWSPHWIPRLELTNAVEIIKFEHGSKYEIKNSTNNTQLRSSWNVGDEAYIDLLGFDPCYGQWIRCRYEADIVFAEEMELENFPFDCQDFTAYFKSEAETSACRILPFPRARTFCSLDPQFSVLSEWELQKIMVEFRHTERSRSRSTRNYSIVAIHIKATRKWSTRADEMLLTFCMMTMGLGAFAMNVTPEDLGYRLTFAITLMLADVASLKLLIQQLPNIPYWTEMDFYMYTCFFYLFLITSWSCLAGLNYEELERADYYAFIFFIVLWFFTNIMFIVRAFLLYNQERASLDYNERQLKKHYKDHRATHNRSSIECKFSIDKVDEQEHDHTLLFSGRVPQKDGIVPLPRDNELLRLGTLAAHN